MPCWHSHRGVGGSHRAASPVCRGCHTYSLGIAPVRGGAPGISLVKASTGRVTALARVLPGWPRSQRSPAAPGATPGLRCVSGSRAGARPGPRHHPGACANSAFLFSGKIFAAGRRVPVAHRIGTARLGLRQASSQAQPMSRFLTDAQLLPSLVRSSLSPFLLVSPPAQLFRFCGQDLLFR